MALEGAGAGRGSAGKTAVAGAKDRATNQVAAGVVSSTSKPVMQDLVGSYAVDEAVVYIDGALGSQRSPGPARGRQSKSHGVCPG